MIEFNDNSYRLSYGFAPRGRGSWGFYFPEDGEVWWTPGSTIFSEAKKLARAETRRRGLNSAVIEVAT